MIWGQNLNKKDFEGRYIKTLKTTTSHSEKLCEGSCHHFSHLDIVHSCSVLSPLAEAIIRWRIWAAYYVRSYWWSSLILKISSKQSCSTNLRGLLNYVEVYSSADLTIGKNYSGRTTNNLKYLQKLSSSSLLRSGYKDFLTIWLDHIILYSDEIVVFGLKLIMKLYILSKVWD